MSNSHDEVAPSPNSFPEKKRGESFEEAFNPLNSPGKDRDLTDQKSPYNVTDLYDRDVDR